MSDQNPHLETNVLLYLAVLGRLDVNLSKWHSIMISPFVCHSEEAGSSGISPRSGQRIRGLTAQRCLMRYDLPSP